MTTADAPKPMEGWQHHAKAAELAATAGRIYQIAQDATREHGGIVPEMHAALFREMQAVTALGQLHATLAALDNGGGRD